MMYPEINPVFLDLGVVQLRWYGLTYLVGFAGAWWLGRIRAKRKDAAVNPDQLEDLIFYGAVGAVLGGRLGYILFYNFDAWLADPLVLLRVWEGGMSFHGGFLGVIVALFLYSKKIHQSFLAVGDFVAPLAPVGLFAGRIGNFINGELWGAPSNVPWAMQVPCAGHYDLCVNKLGLPAGTLLTPPLHPNQLYEATLEGVVLFVVLWWFSSKPRPTMSVAALFLIGYGSFRFLIEFVRMPDTQLGYLAFDWFTMGQLLSLPMILGGVVLMALAYRKT